MYVIITTWATKNNLIINYYWTKLNWELVPKYRRKVIDTSLNGFKRLEVCIRWINGEKKTHTHTHTERERRKKEGREKKNDGGRRIKIKGGDRTLYTSKLSKGFGYGGQPIFS